MHVVDGIRDDSTYPRPADFLPEVGQHLESTEDYTTWVVALLRDGEHYLTATRNLRGISLSLECGQESVILCGGKAECPAHSYTYPSQQRNTRR